MKQLFAFGFCVILVAVSFGSLRGQGIGCPDVTAAPDTSVCGTPCIQLTATPVSGFQTTSYTVQQIPYNPYSFNTGNSIFVNVDDIWSPVLPIGFNFCFYGNNYSQLTVGSNGLLSFDLSYAGAYCPWQILQAIPSPNLPLNSIMSPYHDIDPSVGGLVRWDTLGTAPCRIFVVSWFQVPMYSCTQLQATQQIVLYEATNIIETYILNKPLCSSWNSGVAIHGIQNAAGTAATVVPGRNYPTQWSIQNDAWAFYPSGAQNYSVAWYQQGNATPIATTDTVTVCPQQTTNYIAIANYVSCAGDTVVVRDTASIVIAGAPFTVQTTGTGVSCFGGSNGTATATPNGGAGPFSYLWTPGNLNGQTITGLAPGTYTVVVTDTGGCAISETVTIPEPSPMSLSTTSTNVNCFGQSTGSASVTASGGTPGYTYSWTPGGQTTATATNLAAGNYTVIVTDSAGCMDTATVTITQPPQINTATSTTPVSCFGGNNGAATATATGGTGSFTYLWTPGNLSGSSVSGLSAGTYTVTATDSLGCTNSVQVTITQPTALAASATSTPVSCNGGSNGTATVSASGGTPGYAYQWSPSGGNAATANNLSAGTYTCLITDQNNCQFSVSVTVNQPAALAVGMTSVDETCQGFCDGSAVATPSGGIPPYTYSWSAPGSPTTSGIQGLCSGNYTVTVTDANGCTLVGNVGVGSPAPPVANAGPDASFCEGEGGVGLTGSASGGGGAPYYYTWTCNNPPCGLSCVNCPNPNANPTDTTIYYLVVTDQNGCQSAPDSVVVNVLPKPRVNAGPDVAVCGAPAPCTVLTPTVTNGSGLYNYTWLPGTGLNDSTILNPCARPDTSTIYALVVTDLATGCTSDYTTTDTVSTVLVNVSPTPLANAGPDLVVCEGDSVHLQGIGTGAGPGYDYQWSPANGLSNTSIPNPWASPSLTTIYSLVVWSNGCPSIADDVTVFVTEIPTVDAGQDRDICAGDSAFLDGAAWVSNQVIPDSVVSYAWTPTNGLSATNTEDVWASPGQTQYYYLEATTAAGCSNHDSVLVTINPSPIVDAGDDLVICDGTGPFNLFGDIQWVNNNPPGDLQNIIIKWEPSQYIVGPNDQQNVQVMPDQSMYFYFTVTFNTCTMTDSVLISLIPEVFAEASADTSVICAGDSVTLTASGGIGGANYQWIPTTGVADPNSAVTTAAPDTTTTYMVVITEASCRDTAEVTVEVIPRPQVAFANSFTEGCAPLEISLTALTEDGIFYIWDMGDGTILNEEMLEYTYDSAGTYTVSLSAVNAGGCTGTAASATVVVHEPLQAAFSSDPSFPVELQLPGTLVHFFDETPNSVTWSWNFGDGQMSSLQDPEFYFSEPGSYMVTLTVENEIGCQSQVTNGPFVVKTPDLFIPNVFSPNADGINDYFMVQYTGDQPFNIQIFDRWGVEVFASKNKLERWDGNTESGLAPDGVYYYALRIGHRDFNGNVTLVR